MGNAVRILIIRIFTQQCRRGAVCRMPYINYLGEVTSRIVSGSVHGSVLIGRVLSRKTRQFSANEYVAIGYALLSYLRTPSWADCFVDIRAFTRHQAVLYVGPRTA